MPSITKKQRIENCFFQGSTNHKKHNRHCNDCKHECKQSFKTTILCCPQYTPKIKLNPPVDSGAGEREVL